MSKLDRTAFSAKKTARFGSVGPFYFISGWRFWPSATEAARLLAHLERKTGRHKTP